VAKAADDYTRLNNAIDLEESNSYGSDSDGQLADERLRVADHRSPRATLHAAIAAPRVPPLP